VLHLDHNMLEMLPAGVRFWTALEELQLNDNLLHEICPELGACVNLRKLNLHENRLVTLPHSMGNCRLESSQKSSVLLDRRVILRME
jgi:Leucine-rich repeat (LRR) protein